MPLTNCKSERLTPAIIEMVKNNVPASEICRLLNLSHPTVKKIIRFNNCIPERKVSNCKSRRMESEIVELINKNVSLPEIAKKLDITSTTIKKVAKYNGIDVDGRIRAGKLKQKTERNEEIYKMLLTGEKYQVIADKMNVSKARVEQVAKVFKYRRWEESKKKYQAIVEIIKKDIKDGVPYEKLIKKHNLDDSGYYSKLCYWGLPSTIYRDYKSKRNKKIGREYRSGKIAKEIIKSKEPIVSQPQKIKGIGSVYKICSEQGIYKYPKIGRRIDGGSFEDFAILRLVKKLREKQKMSFQQIADYMNTKKYKTVCGKKFNMANARFKYNDALREGL